MLDVQWVLHFLEEVSSGFQESAAHAWGDTLLASEEGGHHGGHMLQRWCRMPDWSLAELLGATLRLTKGSDQEGLRNATAEVAARRASRDNLAAVAAPLEHTIDRALGTPPRPALHSFGLTELGKFGSKSGAAMAANVGQHGQHVDGVGAISARC